MALQLLFCLLTIKEQNWSVDQAGSRQRLCLARASENILFRVRGICGSRVARLFGLLQESLLGKGLAST
jgi:hypothetical protein